MELVRDFLTANLGDKGSCTRGPLHMRKKFRQVGTLYGVPICVSVSLLAVTVFPAKRGGTDRDVD